MRRLLSAKYLWMITLLCWAHQMNLVVGDFLSLNADFRRIIALALDVVKWFNGHGQALDKLRIEQKLTYNGNSWALILPVITRWTAHYLSLTHLLKVEAALTTCCSRHKPLLLRLGRDAAARDVSAVVLWTVADETFWAQVNKYVYIVNLRFETHHFVRIQIILEPLAIAANVTQAAHTRLDHVLLTLGNLFRVYSDPNLDPQIQTGILGSLEKRWAKADQDVFILAVFLNPYIRQQPFSHAALTHANIYEITARLFTRIFYRQPDLQFLKAFEDYFSDTGDFSRRSMELDMMKGLYESRVSDT
jgi:hypothetical protein